MRNRWILKLSLVIGYLIYSFLTFTVLAKASNYNYDIKFDFINSSIHTRITDTLQIKLVCLDFVTIWMPDSKDIITAELLLDKAMISVQKEYQTLSDTLIYKNYYRQYCFYKNFEGDSIVYINAFCELPEIPTDSSGVIIFKPFDWKNRILRVHDGGECFWTIKINLSKMTFYDFIVNGIA